MRLVIAKEAAVTHDGPAAEQLQVMKRESTGKGATLGDVLKEKLANMSAPAEEGSSDEGAADGDSSE